MKNTLVAILLVLGVSVWGSAFACDGSDKDKSMSGTSVPASPVPAPSTSK
jgi:hypothetical protein